MTTATRPSISVDILNAGVVRVRPTYVYDLERLRERCRDLEAIPVGRKSIFFATMANDHPAILSCIRDLGHGVFVNSPRHLRLVHELGFTPAHIVYAATNMMAEEMELCLQLGVRLILDSLGQLRLFAELARPGQEVGLRLSVGSALDGAELWEDPSYRFGLLPSELPLAVEIARRHGVRIVGAHSYFGTDLISAELLAEGIERLGRAADVLPDLRYIDVGGGFGVTTPGDSRFNAGLPRPGGATAAARRRRHDCFPQRRGLLPFDGHRVPRQGPAGGGHRRVDTPHRVRRSGDDGVKWLAK